MRQKTHGDLRNDWLRLARSVIFAPADLCDRLCAPARCFRSGRFGSPRDRDLPDARARFYDHVGGRAIRVDRIALDSSPSKSRSRCARGFIDPGGHHFQVEQIGFGVVGTDILPLLRQAERSKRRDAYRVAGN